MRRSRVSWWLVLSGTLLAAARSAPAQQPVATPIPEIFATTPAPTPTPKPTSLILRVNEDVFFRFGFLLQPQAEFLQDAASRGYSQNYFVRRARVLLGGSLAKNVTFFFETDAPNLGKSIAGVKQSANMIVQDAFVEWKIADAFSLGGGLFLVPLSRNTLTSAASLLPIDYGSYSFSYSGPLQNVVGRDEGFHARGYFLKNHLEYRAGVFQGQRDPASRQAPRYLFRVMYNVFDTEAASYFYTGTNLGKKRILAFGGSFDTQKDYVAHSFDAFLDMPVGGSAMTVLANYIRYDGGKTLTNLPYQNTLHTEFGFHLASKVTPYGIFEWKDVTGTNTGDESRYGAGLAFFRNGHNFTLKAQYVKIDPQIGKSQNQFNIQLQGFFY